MPTYQQSHLQSLWKVGSSNICIFCEAGNAMAALLNKRKWINQLFQKKGEFEP
jgi:hypothetical protein